MNKKDFILIQAHLHGFYRYIFSGYDKHGNGVYMLTFEKRHYDLNLKEGLLVNQNILNSFSIEYYCDAKKPGEAWCLHEKDMPKKIIVNY